MVSSILLTSDCEQMYCKKNSNIYCKLFQPCWLLSHLSLQVWNDHKPTNFTSKYEGKGKLETVDYAVAKEFFCKA